MNRQALRLLGVFLVYDALAVAVTYPLVTRLRSGVPHDTVDPLLNTWLLWWNAHSVPFSARWWDGPFFHPVPGVLSFSENLVGLAFLTTPLQWLGASPLAAYNAAYILSFASSAFAMHLLCRSLGLRSALCFVAGLAYGFAPYRAGHLAHLQVLFACFIPLVLLGLHRFVETGRRRWLVVFAAAWVLQGLSNGYYLAYVSVLVGAWLLWFVPPRRCWGRLGWLLLAWTLSGLALAPVLRQYSLWHARYGFTRTMPEIEALSADALSLISPAPALAHWPAGSFDTGSWLFPGATLPLILGSFLVVWRWRRRLDEGPVATLFAALAALAAVIAAVTALRGPWRLSLAGLSLSVGALSKPLAVSFYALIFAVVSSRTLRSAWRRGSLLTFYLLAGGAVILLALGPRPHLAGVPFWDKGPYWYLLKLPHVTAFRAPERIAMLAVFCFALAGALALGRLVGKGSRHERGLVTLAALALLWDGWLGAVPIHAAPEDFSLPAEASQASVLELPLGMERDTGAMYRGMTHGRPVVNGYSGYDPAHYHALRLGIERGEPGVLSALRENGPVLVLLNASAPSAELLQRLILAEDGVRALGEEDGRRSYLLPGARRQAPPVFGSRIPLDVSRGSQRRAVFDLGESGPIGAVVLELGAGVSSLPQRVTVEVGEKPGQWTTVWYGPIAGLALRGGLRDPVRVPVTLETPGASAALSASGSRIGRSRASRPSDPGRKSDTRALPAGGRGAARWPRAVGVVLTSATRPLAPSSALP